jgi:hypothetical protein
MDGEQITLTREALYEQVWKTPMSRLAADFGISDVALAKICRKLDVPIPGRGYWARVTNGQKVKQPKLPKARAGTRTEFMIAKREPRVPLEPVEILDVKVSESLATAHTIIRKLVAIVDGREPGHQKTLHLRGDSEATLRLSEATKRRALLILDALLKALESRGHALSFKVPKDSWGNYDLQVKVEMESLKLFVAEPLVRSDHKPTAKEQADHTRYGSTFAPKHDFSPSGRLTLRARGNYAMTRSWSDGSQQRLEDVLGVAVLGIEDLAKRTAAYRAELEESHRRQEEQERRRQTQTVLNNYESALGGELERAADDLRRAMAIRELIRAVAQAPVPESKTEPVRTWLAWAAAWADEIDPRTDASRVARIVTPDVATMSRSMSVQCVRALRRFAGPVSFDRNHL